MNAAVASTAVGWPASASPKTATTGKNRFANWFQRLVSVTARATGAPSKPHPRRIPTWPAMPTATPPGATIDSAVEACVIVSAGTKRRPGSATCHGGANVTTFSTTATASSDEPLPREGLDDVPDVAVIGHPRQHEDERRHDDGDPDRAQAEAASRRGAYRASSCVVPHRGAPGSRCRPYPRDDDETEKEGFEPSMEAFTPITP